MTEEIGNSPNRGKERLPIILDFARDYEHMWREERGATIEAEIVRALIQARNEVKGVKLPVKVVADILNMDRSEHERFLSKTVIGFLTSLGFRKTRMGGGRAAIIYDTKLLERRAGQFGLLDELRQMEEERPTVEKIEEGDVTVEFLIDINTDDVSLPNQPIYKQFLGKQKRFTKGQRITVDQEAANVLSMMGVINVLQGR